MDLREWLAKEEKAGELEMLSGVDWRLEIGCLTYLNWRRKNSPGLLFDNIKGYPPGFKLLTSSTRTPGQVARMLDIPENLAPLQFLSLLRKKLKEWDNILEGYPAKIVDSGPALDEVYSGNEVDLFKFPAPQWHELDGGRYIGTGDAVITRDPDNGMVNVGTYRIMLHDRQTTGLFIAPGSHGRMHLEKYHTRGLPCPIAISLGHHPLIFRIACLEVAEGTEYNYMGAISGNPVEVIEEELTGLPIPAHSEIVLAGWCPPGKTRVEGPFGESHGYYASQEAQAPIIEVERLYQRRNPIMLGSPPGRPPNDSSYFQAMVSSALLHNQLTETGVPDIQGVYLSEAGWQRLVIVSLRQRYAGHAKQVALLASQLARRGSMNRYTIVVDEDIDPTDTDAVLWAMSTRSDPEEDIDIIRRTRSASLDPVIRKPARVFFNSRATIDACKPYEWLDAFPKVVEYNPEMQQRMRQRFASFA